MNKLLVICGPTATGKTSLGISLAKKYNGEIVSADSRHVYRGMDIITGKDLPENSELRIKNYVASQRDPASRVTSWYLASGGKLGINNKNLSVGFREKEGIPVWLVDIVELDYIFNVGEYVKIARLVIEDIWRRAKLPVIVGGSGLYINSLTKPLSNILIPPDKKLRKELEKLNSAELGELLSKTNPLSFEKMNRSDSLNPRRLIRAIEIASHENKKSSEPPNFFDRIKQDSFFVGLTADVKILHDMIDRRVEERVKMGALDEAYKIFESGLSVDLPALTSTGFKPLLKHIEKIKSLAESVRLWKLAEHGYARNQKRWFKRDKRIKWFNIWENNYIAQIEQLVERWYTENN